MKYQVLPDLSAEDYQALKADIAARGIMVAVEYDEGGDIIDGHHRVRACHELGIADWPRVVRKYADDAAKLTQARKLNIARRHLDQSAKRSLIEAELKAAPERSNRQVARELGVDDKTVGVVREKLETTAEIPQLEKTVGADGKARTTAPARQTTVAQIHIPGDDGQAAIHRQSNRIKREEKELRQEERKQHVAELAASIDHTSDRYELRHEDYLNAFDLEANSLDWVITDPPYPREFLHLYDGLAQIAEHVLKPGGSLLCMVGQSYLPDIIAYLGKRLSYHWTLAYLTPGGQATQLFPRRVNTFWKPVLWFVKGEYKGDWIGDTTRSEPNDNDKRLHHWGQSESGMADLMARFVKPGDSVLDPFMGAGTTGAIALDLGASFIGFDTDVDAFNTAAVRLSNAKLVA